MAEVQKLIIPKSGKDVEKRNAHSLLMGMKNGTNTLEDSLAVIYKIKLNTVSS